MSLVIITDFSNIGTVIFRKIFPAFFKKFLTSCRRGKREKIGKFFPFILLLKFQHYSEFGLWLVNIVVLSCPHLLLCFSAHQMHALKLASWLTFVTALNSKRLFFDIINSPFWPDERVGCWNLLQFGALLGTRKNEDEKNN